MRGGGARARRRRSTHGRRRRRGEPRDGRADHGAHERRSPQRSLALEAFAAEGIDASKIVVAHAGDSNDLDYLRALADQGAILGCDRFGIEHFNPLARRIETLTALVAEGYADRIILSHDAACFIDFFTGDGKFSDERPSYLLVSQTVVPALLEAGVTREQVEAMLVENPRRYFGG